MFCFQHGESEFNAKGKIGGDSELSDRGWEVRIFFNFLFACFN